MDDDEDNGKYHFSMFSCTSVDNKEYEYVSWSDRFLIIYETKKHQMIIYHYMEPNEIYAAAQELLKEESQNNNKIEKEINAEKEKIKLTTAYTKQNHKNDWTLMRNAKTLNGVGVIKEDENIIVEKLKGKVKSIDEIEYPLTEKFGEVVKDINSNSTKSHIFDEQGSELVENDYMYNEPTPRKKITYKYDTLGNRIEKSTFSCTEWNSTLTEKTISKYDNKGNVVQETVYSSDGTPSEKYTYQYDANGNKIEENHLTNSMDFSRNLIPFGNSEKKTFKYDEKGNLVVEIWYNSAGGTDRKYTYQYDDKGNKIDGNRIEEKQAMNGAASTYKYIYKYDDKGNEIEETAYINKKVLYKTTYIIEKKNREPKMIYVDDKGNKMEQDGYIIEKVWYKLTYKNDYDKNLNWIKQILYKNDVPQISTERVIQYY
jgi:YD repeat-containing protein